MVALKKNGFPTNVRLIYRTRVFCVLLFMRTNFRDIRGRFYALFVAAIEKCVVGQLLSGQGAALATIKEMSFYAR